jgi:hypothetical protein
MESQLSPYAVPQPYPVLRFMDGDKLLMELDADTWLPPKEGEEICIILEDGTSVSRWRAGAVSHMITVRQIREGEAMRNIPLALLRVTTIAVSRIEERDNP